jgi:hypothetical protein
MLQRVEVPDLEHDAEKWNPHFLKKITLEQSAGAKSLQSETIPL